MTTTTLPAPLARVELRSRDSESRVLELPSLEGLEAASDAEVLERQRALAAVRREVDAAAARVAAELARRSARELGYQGLAQREGLRSAEQLLERVAGVTPSEARAMVRVGGAIVAGETAPAAAAVAAGSLSVAAADAILTGLGPPTETIAERQLAEAEALLVAVAAELPVRRLAIEARALRERLDAEGVADREETLRQRRFLRLTALADGMTRVSGLLDPESAALVTDAFDLVTAPRRGGPRFVDAEAVARAESVVRDPRTTEQLLHDAFVELVRIAGEADPGRVYVQRKPAVSIHVSRDELAAGTGAARLENPAVPVTIATARRAACATGAVPILFDGGRVLDVGRTQRLFTERQRVALAARDGGCRFPGCDRPPSWCEAHHLDGWAGGGRTDVGRGVLLCRFHHLLVHNQGWRIETRSEPRAGQHGGVSAGAAPAPVVQFFAIPPPARGGAAVPMPARGSPVVPRVVWPGKPSVN